MSTYYVNEAVFSLPDRGFIDRTLHRLESPLDGDESLGVEIRRLPMPHGKSLRQLVDDEIADTKTRVDGFSVVEDAEVALAGAPAIVVRARLRALDLPYQQLQAHVALGDTWIMLTVTGPSTERALCDETFERVLCSVAWRN